MRPESLSGLFELLDRYGDDAKILAGGQSLVPALNMRLSAPAVLVDINGIGELSGIRVDADTVTIGALTRHREVERSAEIAEHLPLIHQAMPNVAHAAVRNRGTFGGSIAFADPAAELPACALALDATFTLRSSRGERIVRAREFFRRLYETALEPGEVLISGTFPKAREADRSAFQELARRHGDYPIVGLAARAKRTGNVLSELRLAYFGVGETPVLAARAQGLLEGVPCTTERIAQAQAALEADLSPFDDAAVSAATRRHLARVLLGRVTAQLIGK